MARIQLRPCENEFKQDADFIEIPIDDGRYMKIYRTYGVYETTKGNYKREETVHVKVMRHPQAPLMLQRFGLCRLKLMM